MKSGGDSDYNVDLDQLELEMNGVTRTFSEWTSDFVDTYYPDLGQRCYRVPALHFNRQTLHKEDTFKGFLLHSPEDSNWRGDLAHTLMLDNMEKLGQQLHDVQGKPLFTISCLDYDNYLARLKSPKPKTKDRRRKRCSTKGSTGKTDKAASTPGDGKGQEMKTDEEQKRQLPPRPTDLGNQRGEVDIVLLHQDSGVTLIEVKSTGMVNTKWKPTDTEQCLAIRDSVQKAVQQLKRGRDVFSFIMPDLSCFPCVTLVIALPFISRRRLDKALAGFEVDSEICFLTEDDLDIKGTAEEEVGVKESGSSACRPTKLFQWWQTNMAGIDESLSPQDQKTIVGRVCGLLSIVSVWTRSKPRVEVRTTAQAVSEAAERISDIVLLPRQAALLARPSPTRLCLTGPMGSGKTLLLQLKGRQWLQEGRRVVILNVRSTGRGRPIGHLLEESIRRESCGATGKGSVERYDLALNETDVENFQMLLKRKGPTDNICFVSDELTFDMFLVIERLATLFPQSPIWCVSSFIQNLPQDFQLFRVNVVMRCPPSVQLLLKELDLNPAHRDAYSTRSATRGLPCDGPPVIFIQHQLHSTSGRLYDCSCCAKQLADILQNFLGFSFSRQKSQRETDAESEQTANTAAFRTKAFSAGRRTDVQQNKHLQKDAAGKSFRSKSSVTAVEATPLSFRDVLFLITMPLAYYKHYGNNQWETTVPEILRFLKYVNTSTFFVTLKEVGVPLKVIVDNTSQEIAMPLKDQIILTDVQAVPSLERKVVIFVPGGPPLASTHVDTSTSSHSCGQHYTSQDLSCSGVSSPNIQDKSRAGQSGCRQEEQSKSDGRKGGEAVPAAVLHDFAVGSMDLSGGEVADLLTSAKGIINSSLDADVTAFSEDDAKTAIDSMIDNMTIVTRPADQKEDSFPGLRMGMTIRGDWPMPPIDTDHVTANSSSASNQNSKQQNITEDSVFHRPDLGIEDYGHRESELQRIRQALSSLSMDDQDWLFMAASRCLSQFIAIIP